MAARLTIRPAIMADVYAVAANLRFADHIELHRLGLSARKSLRVSFRGSIWARTAEHAGEVAAMWGIGGAMLSDEASPWLMTTPIFERMFHESPRTVLREGRKQVADMLAAKRTLSNHVDASYLGACRLLDALGFRIEAPAPYGPNGAMFCRFWMTR